MTQQQPPRNPHGDDRTPTERHGYDRRDRAEEALPPEPGDLADRAADASLDPDEQGDVGGDQDLDTAGTEADQEKGRFADGPRARRDGAR